MKWRNSKERELLSSGGSRESTLPNKGNPNPDLSDVCEDVKKLDKMDDNLSDNEGNESPPGSPHSSGPCSPLNLNIKDNAEDFQMSSDSEDEEIHVS